jgi:hypothetical protein
MSYCTGVSDAAFVNLRGISSLYMWACGQQSITASAFSHLKGIQEISMAGCTLAQVTAAFGCLRGARSVVFSSSDNPFLAAIQAGDVAECRRLLETRALGSNSWLYAGVTFRDLLPPHNSAHHVIAMS